MRTGVHTLHARRQGARVERHVRSWTEFSRVQDVFLIDSIFFRECPKSRETACAFKIDIDRYEGSLTLVNFTNAANSVTLPIELAVRQRSRDTRTRKMQSAEKRRGGKLRPVALLEQDGFVKSADPHLDVKATVREISNSDSAGKFKFAQIKVVACTGALTRYTIPASAERTALNDVIIKPDGGEVACSRVSKTGKRKRVSLQSAGVPLLPLGLL